jgi:hypothetical protein
VFKKSEFLMRLGRAAATFRSSTEEEGSNWEKAMRAARLVDLPVDPNGLSESDKLLEAILHFRIGGELTKNELFIAMAVVEAAWEYYQEKSLSATVLER